jgi:hypothetical protein
MQICFEELRRSQEISPQPNFLILLGNRYGWRPLPEEVSEDEFRALEEAALSEPARNILRDWYRRDENAVPPVYVLQSRKQDLSDGRDYTNDQVWNEVQRVLWDVINHAYPADQLAGRFDNPTALDVPLPAIVRFQASATEQEIWRGALGVPNASEHVLAFVREIENIEAFQRPVDIRDFVDVDESGAIDAVSQDALRQLKEQIRKRLGEGNVIGIEHARLTRSTNEKGEPSIDVTARHLEELCARVRAALEAIIHRQINEYWGTSGSDIPSARELELERLEHQRFGEERAPAGSFVGRERHLQAIKSYLLNDSYAPLVIHGASGCGKTALLAKAAFDFSQSAVRNPQSAIVTRFIGVTPRSSDIRSLLASLCQELRQRHPLETPLPGDVHELTRELQEHFKAAAAHEPLILFLDALDQLADAENGRSLFWIPFGPLPSHVKLIVSCLSDRAPDDPVDDPAGQPYAALKRRGLAEEDFINLDTLSEGEAQTLLFERWFPQARRTLNHEQAQRVRKRLTSDACRLPLYLKVLFEEARLWRSYDSVSQPGKDVSELLGALFNRLGDPANHGATVECALGYIASARRGLTEMEILEVLHHDPDYKKFLDNITAQTGHKLPDNPPRIPIAIWSRLRFDLAPYLAEHAAPGGTVLNFYHRQVGEYVRGRFLDTPEKRRNRHRALARYFRDLPLWLGENRVPNVRRVFEQPFQETHGGLWGEIEATLCDICFAGAKCMSGMTYELVADYDAALGAWPDYKRHAPSGLPAPEQGINLAPASASPALAEWRGFVQKHAQRLTQYPTMFVALTNHEGFAAARAQAEAGAWPHPWLQTFPELLPPAEASAVAGLCAEVTGSLELSRDRAAAIAVDCALAFCFEQLGVVRVIDVRAMRETEVVLSIRRERPLLLVSSPDATGLGVFYESGEAELYRCILGPDKRPVALELAQAFRFHLPECEDPIAVWHDGACWFQARADTLAHVAIDSSGIAEEPLAGGEAGELCALVFAEGTRLVALRQSPGALLVTPGVPGLRLAAADVIAACRCDAQEVAVATSDGALVVYNLAAGLAPRAKVQVGLLWGALGWDRARLLWLSERGCCAWAPSEAGPTAVQDRQEIFPTGARPRQWFCRTDGTVLLLTSHSIVAFCIADGSAGPTSRIQDFFGGPLWRAVRKHEKDHWLVESRPLREVLLGRGVLGGLYCAPDGDGHFFAATTQGLGMVFDPATQKQTLVQNLPYALNTAAGDPQCGCWFTDRVGDIYFADVDGRCQLVAKIELRDVTGAKLQSCGEYLVWSGYSSHRFAGRGLDTARSLAFFRRVSTPAPGLERLGEQHLHPSEGICVAICFDRASNQLVTLWTVEGGRNSYRLRLGGLEDFVSWRIKERDITGLRRARLVQADIAACGRWLGVLDSAGQFSCVRTEDAHVVATLAGSKPFTALATGADRAEFWLVENHERVHRCVLRYPS